LIGQINLPSSKGHKFVLLATDYFTKLVEAIQLKKVSSENMVEFVKEYIIYKFGIPQTITTDQGTQFTSSEFRDFAKSMGIKLLNSSPYYAQANGQAEASNKTMIKIIQKKIDQKPKRWHSVLNEALWAY
jgi:transposase InsO family protein